VVGLLGEGGMGKVQLAVQHSLVVTAVLRRKLLETAFNRQLTALFILAPAGIALAGVIAFVTGQARSSSISSFFCSSPPHRR
jgi:hypothetical protein